MRRPGRAALDAVPASRTIEAEEDGLSAGASLNVPDLITGNLREGRARAGRASSTLSPAKGAPAVPRSGTALDLKNS